MIIVLCYDMNLCVMIIYGSHLLFLSYFCCYFLKNRINRKIWRLLCRAYAHGKGHLVSFAVCIRTAKEAPDFACSGSLPCGQARGAGQSQSLPSGFVAGARQRQLARHRTGARQRPAARQWAGAWQRRPHGKELWRAAKKCRTAVSHGARQRNWCTAKALPCGFGVAHGNDSVAVQNVTERTLPSKFGPLPCKLAARQRPLLL